MEYAVIPDKGERPMNEDSASVAEHEGNSITLMDYAHVMNSHFFQK